MKMAIYILASLVAVAVTAALLATFVAPERIRELLARFLTIILGPFEMLREGSLSVIRKAWQLMQAAARSVGIAGEHWIQRLVGAILLTALSGVCFLVDYLLAKETISGLVGGASAPAFMGLSLEAMGAVSLVTSLIIWGCLLLDTVGVTHITIFSSDKYNVWLKRSVTGVAAFGFFLTAFLLAQLGALRFDILQAEGKQAPVQSLLKIPEAVAAPVGSVIPDQGEWRSGGPSNQVLSMDQVQTVLEPAGMAELPREARNVLVGMPVSSAMAGLFSAIAIIPAMGMAITFPVFLAVIALFGFMFVIARAGERIINLLYNFVLMLANIFIDVGSRRRGATTPESPEPAPHEANEPLHEEDNPTPPATVTINQENNKENPAQEPVISPDNVIFDIFK